MFPWLPFLSLHNGDPNHKSKRKRRPGSRKHSSLTSVWLNVDCGEGVGDVRVEYLPVPFQPRYTATASSSTDLGFGSTTATVTSENRADSAPLGDLIPQNVPQHRKRSAQRPETPSRSPRSTSVSNSRPGSAAATQQPQPVTEPPPQPRPARRSRMFETSSAMLEIFGGAPTPQQQEQPKPSQQEEKDSGSLNAALASTAVYEATVRQPIVPTENGVSRAEPNVEGLNATRTKAEPNVASTEPNIAGPSQQITLNVDREQNSQAQSASVTFQQIPSAPATLSSNERPHFGRTNALSREGISRSEWETVTSQTTATISSFQTVPDHDMEYERARHRGNWDGAAASFNQINQYTPREISPMRQQNEVTANCPAEGELRRRQQSGHLRNGNAPEEGAVRDSSVECPLQPLQSVENTQLTENGHTGAKKREGVADLFSDESADTRWERTQCAFKPADAAGEPSTSSGGVYAQEGTAPFATDPKPQPNGSSTDFHQARSQPDSPACANGVKNGVPDEKTQKAKLRFILSVSEDGCGMVSASGNGASGESTTPILIKNAQIVNDDAIFAADVLVADGQIKQILPGLDVPENAEVIDANGNFLLPAGIDLHCELDNVEDLVNATKDALSGGTTTIVNVVKAANENESLVAAFDRARAQIDSKAECLVALSVQIQKWSPAVKSQVEEICQKKGVNNFILDVQTDAEVFEAMEQLKKMGALVRILPENRNIVALLEKQFASLQANEAYVKSRPAQLEADSIHRLAVFAQLTNSPLSIMSVGSSEACRAVQTGRQQGALISAEISVSALANDSISSSAPQTRIPIRSGSQNAHDALELLANGPFSVCVSDHSSIRRGKIPVGSLAVGERLQILWEKAVASGQIDLMHFVRVTSTNPAKLLNIYPKKGRIAVGADADLVIWNAQASHRITSRNQNEKNSFDGLTVSAAPELTICGGKVAYRNGKLSGEKPAETRFVALQPNAPHVFSVVQLRDKTLNLAKPVGRKESTTSNGSSNIDTDVRPNSRGTTPQDNYPEKQKPVARVRMPPGGRSTGFW